MTDWIRRNWKWAVPLGAGGLVVGIWLFFGWFGFHTLFFDRTVAEAAPTFATTTTTTTAPAVQDPAPATTSTSSPGETLESDVGRPEPTPTSTTVATGPMVLVEGTFIDRSHPTSGMAVVLGDGDGQRVLRLEGFRTDNGPDLFVYLSAASADSPAGDFDADFVDLGVLKGNVGDQNYEIPPEVDLDRYSTAVIWCRRFAVVFGAADLEA